ncbi:hypothetical protein A2W24_04335 [Microgenomates group bacterium RBG_16_45_19]|nr:MAG: hypothetical protein A2W24_04335 [Microgenomates group bacterium RBG_16_45_19]
MRTIGWVTWPLLSLSLMVTQVKALMINEFMPDPSDPNDQTEWIELYNETETSMELDNWQVDDSEGGTRPYKIPVQTLAARQFLVIDKSQSQIGLNNSQDQVRLMNPEGTVVDSIDYNQVPTDQVMARVPDGSGNWQVTTPTKGLTNQSQNQTNPAQPTTGAVTTSWVSRVYFSEIYACPEVSQSEWIELVNPDNAEKSLAGLTIQDEGKHRLALSGRIAANGYHIQELSQAIINNQGDNLELLGNDGSVLDRASFEICEAGQSWIKSGESWQMTETVTKGGQNRFSQSEEPTPVIKSERTPTISAKPTGPITMSPPKAAPSLGGEQRKTLGTSSANTDFKLQTASPSSQAAESVVQGKAGTRQKGSVLIFLGGGCLLAAAGWQGWKTYQKELV